jgi:hypothetical protein
MAINPETYYAFAMIAAAANLITIYRFLRYRE